MLAPCMVPPSRAVVKTQFGSELSAVTQIISHLCPSTYLHNELIHYSSCSSSASVTVEVPVGPRLWLRSAD